MTDKDNIDKALPNVEQTVTLPPEEEIVEAQETIEESAPGEPEVVEQEDGSVDINFEPGAVNQAGTEDHYTNLAELLPDNVLDKIGGVEYLKDLVKKLPTSAHIETYAGIIKEKSLMRKLISSSTNIIEQVHQSEEGNVKDILDKAETEIFGITTDTKTNDGLVKIGPIVNQLIDVIYDKKNNNKID